MSVYLISGYFCLCSLLAMVCNFSTFDAPHLILLIQKLSTRFTIKSVPHRIPTNRIFDIANCESLSVNSEQWTYIFCVLVAWWSRNNEWRANSKYSIEIKWYVSCTVIRFMFSECRWASAISLPADGLEQRWDEMRWNEMNWLSSCVKWQVHAIITLDYDEQRAKLKRKSVLAPSHMMDC